MFRAKHTIMKEQLEKADTNDSIYSELRATLVLNALSSIEKSIIAISDLKTKVKQQQDNISINTLLLIGAESEMIYNQLQYIRHEHHL